MRIAFSNNKKMKTRHFFAPIVIALFSITLFSCSTKQGAIRQMENLSIDLRDNSSYYTVKDWEDAAKKFSDIRMRMAKHDYTPAERRKIGELEGQCARYMVEGIKEGALNRITSIGNEIRGILEGLGIKY